MCISTYRFDAKFQAKPMHVCWKITRGYNHETALFFIFFSFEGIFLGSSVHLILYQIFEKLTHREDFSEPC